MTSLLVESHLWNKILMKYFGISQTRCSSISRDEGARGCRTTSRIPPFDGERARYNKLDDMELPNTQWWIFLAKSIVGVIIIISKNFPIKVGWLGFVLESTLQHQHTFKVVSHTWEKSFPFNTICVKEKKTVRIFPNSPDKIKHGLFWKHWSLPVEYSYWSNAHGMLHIGSLRPF